MKYYLRRTQYLEVETDDWTLRPDETEWTEEAILELAEMNYDWGDPRDHYEIYKPKRFQFCPFWKVTQWGFLPEYIGKINEGGDETRGSKFVIIPMIGTFVWFDKHPCSDPTCEAHALPMP